jgi:hypothetical protein
MTATFEGSNGPLALIMRGWINFEQPRDFIPYRKNLLRGVSIGQVTFLIKTSLLFV